MTATHSCAHIERCAAANAHEAEIAFQAPESWGAIAWVQSCQHPGPSAAVGGRAVHITLKPPGHGGPR